MIQIENIGEYTVHDSSFNVDRPNGRPVYLLIIIQTTAKFLNGETWQTTAPHTAVLFKPGQRHRYRADGSCYIDNWAHMTSSQSLFGEHFPFGVPIALHNPKDYDDLFHMIYTEYYGASPRQSLILHSLATALLNKIADESDTKEYPDLYYSLANLRNQIYSYPSRDWNVQRMAKQLNISSGYLHASYQRFFNTSCIKDVIQSRTQLARQLLTYSNKPLDEIAEACGYRHTEHFVRQFKLYVGITPGRFRRK